MSFIEMSLTAADVKKAMNLPGIANEGVEYLIDIAADVINLFAGEGTVPNMTGNPGSKTLSTTTVKRGFVWLVVRAVYYSYYKDLTGKTVGDISVQPVDLLSNPKVLETIQLAAARLSPTGGASGAEPEIHVRRG